MCKWYCLSEGPSTNLTCLNCGAHYCGACLHGDAGKMKSLVKCAACGRCPTRRGKNMKYKADSSHYLTRVVDRPSWNTNTEYMNGKVSPQLKQSFHHLSLKEQQDLQELGRQNQHSHYRRMLHGGTALQDSNGMTGIRVAQRTAREKVIAQVESETLLPGWFAVENPNATGTHDLIYYVNSATKETTWEKPVVPPPPGAGQDTFPPPPPPQQSGRRQSMSGHSRRGVPNVVLESRAQNPHTVSTIGSVLGQNSAAVDRRQAEHARALRRFSAGQDSNHYGKGSATAGKVAKKAGGRLAYATHRTAAAANVSMSNAGRGQCRYQGQERMTVSQYLGQDSSSKGQKKGGNVFDRLTDSSTYNSTHKHRFDADGRGRGAAGRDRINKGGGSHHYQSHRRDQTSAYQGSTNTGTNQTFHDISEFLTRR